MSLYVINLGRRTFLLFQYGINYFIRWNFSFNILAFTTFLIVSGKVRFSSKTRSTFITVIHLRAEPLTGWSLLTTKVTPDICSVIIIYSGALGVTPKGDPELLQTQTFAPESFTPEH